MSLSLVVAQDVTQYVQDVLQNSGDPPSDVGSATGLGTIAGSGNGRTCVKYHTGRDRLFCVFEVSAAFQNDTGLGFIDPLLFSTSPPNADYRNTGTLGGGAGGAGRLNLDQYDPDTGQQRVFTTDGGKVTIELDPVTLVATLQPFTGPNGDFDEDGGLVANYTWNSLDDHNTYWTGLTDGLPSETEQEGSGVYPDGLFLTHVQSGEINGQSFSNRFAWIDLRTRECVGILGATNVPGGDFTPIGFPAEVSGTPTGDAGESPIAGDEFDWLCAQYVPDVDATFARPKGRLLLTNRDEVPLISSTSGGEVLRNYIRFIDFNPFGVAAASNAPSRTHGRVRLTTRALVEVAPMFGIAGQDFVPNPSSPPGVQFDPLRQRFVAFLENQVDILTDGTDRFCAFGGFSLRPQVSVVTSPAARDVPRTNDVVQFDAIASGDIGERISGVDVQWTLTRRSTEGEVLDASTFPGSSFVDNPPIDEDASGDAVLTVVSDSVTLVEGADYSVNTTTGEITWITDQSGAALVTASYEHRSTGATPPHGVLLTTTSQTDGDGRASTQVSYPDDDDLVGEIDQLEAEEA